MIPWGLIIRFGLPVLGLFGAFAAFNLWLSGVKAAAYTMGREAAIQELAEDTERLKAEHKAEAEELRDKLEQRDQRYARDIADITRQALSGAAPDRVALDNDTRRVLNARTARSNTDIEEAAGGIIAALPAIADED